MPEVVLVQPKVGDWDMVRSHPSLPLSLLSAASLVNQEYNVVLIDMRRGDDWKRRLKAELDKNPLCVGTTSLTGRQIRYALQISRFIKENSNAPVVWGGESMQACFLSQQLRISILTLLFKVKAK